MAQANIKAVISAQDNASATLKKFGRSAGEVGQSIENGLKKAAVAGAAAGVAVIAFGAASVKAFQESEDAIAQTNAVLASTKGVAGVTATAVTDLATALQKTTKYSDEEVRSAENLLLTFTKISQDIFPDATKIVLDMSTALGQDLKSSSIQVGKALQDPILGVTALRRVGVNFSKDQQEVIKKLVETGKTAEAQKMILQELSTEFGGSASEAAKTFSGRVAQLKNQFNDMQESIGKTIINGLTPLATRLADFVASDKFQAWLQRVIDWLNINIPIAINYVANTLIPSMKNAFDDLWPVIQTTLKVTEGLIGYILTNGWVIRDLAEAFVAVKVAAFLSGAVTAFTTAMTAIRAQAALAAGSQGIGLIGASFSTLSSTLSAGAQVNIIIAGAVAALMVLQGMTDVFYSKLREAYGLIDAIKKKADADITAARNQVHALLDEQGKAKAGVSQKQLSDSVRNLYIEQESNRNFRASGGSVTAGTPYTVGEQGREVFVPNTNGTIIPNDKLGGSGGVVNVSFNGVFTGNESDFRALAIKVFKAAADVAGMQNNDISSMTTQQWRRV